MLSIGKCAVYKGKVVDLRKRNTFICFYITDKTSVNLNFEYN